MQPDPRRAPDPADLLRAALTGTEAAAPWAAPTVAELAAAFPDLTVHERIGQGGMAAVYRATQVRLGRTVALKVMRPDLARQPQFVERFVREARALAALTNQHVLAMHDFGERDGVCYLVTEYVDGANLRELMQLGRLSPAEVLRIVPQICAGLHFAHRHGVVHRDVKPENVLVDRDGIVKLADFGLAKLAGDPGLTVSGVALGTPHYMAPEQWRSGADVDHRADIYSLGVVLYELLTGRLPVGTYEPASRQPGVPRGIDEVVQRSLQQEPTQRYQDVREVQSDLERQGRGAAVSAVPTTARSAFGLLFAAVAVMVFGAVALFVFWQLENGFVAEADWVSKMRVQRTERAMEKVREVVLRGEPWTGEVPEAPAPVVNGALHAETRQLVAWSAGAALLGLALALAWLAQRRTVPASSSREQFVVARLILWSPVLLLLFAPLWWLAWRLGGTNDDRPAEIVLFLLAIVLFFVVRALWLASGRRADGAAQGSGVPARILAAVGVAGLVACVVTAAVAPRPPHPVHGVRTPLRAETLVGATSQQVIDRLGPPRSITVTGDSTIWGYLGLDGRVHDEVLQISGGRVSVHEATDVPLLPMGTPAPPYLGQPLADAVEQLGAAVETVYGDLTRQVRFANGITLTIGNGDLVVGIER